MTTLARCFVSLVALIEGAAFIVEMFLWGPDRAERFNFLRAELFEDPGVAVMAHNQGLYNAFLAIGLLWALIEKDARHARRLAICFLAFVFVAGIYGTLGALHLADFYFPIIAQSVPAGIGLALLLLDRSRPA